MRPFSIESLRLCALIVPVITALNAPPQSFSPHQGTTLRPINIVDYETSMGLERRESNDLSVLDPQSQSELVYGSSGENGPFLLANLTLHAQDGLPIVLLEGFEELGVEVNCQDDEGTLSLTFASTDAFDHAKMQWGYVNKADDGKFLLIANQDGCGSDGQRQPYIVSNITEDDGTLTTALAAQGVPWSQVAGSYELQFGHAIPIPRVHGLKRGIWEHAENAGEDVANTTEGNFNNSKSANFPIDVGRQDQRMTIYTDSEAGLTIDCTNCFVTGSLEVTGYILVQDFKLQDLVLTASPDSVFAALELEASMTADYGSDSLKYKQDLFTGSIPGTGINIPGIMNIGPTLTYSVGGNCSFSGSATVDFGLQATIPDGAQIVADYGNRGASTATGFSGGELTPIFGVPNASVSVTLTAFSQLTIDFGVDLTDLGTVGVSLTVKLPEVSATLTAKLDERGACSQEAGASKTGIELDSTINIEVDLNMVAELEDEGPHWKKPLFSDPRPLYSHCYPLNIHDHLPPSNATRVSTLPSIISGSAYPSGSSAFIPGLGLGRRWLQNSSSLASLPTGYLPRPDPQTSSSSPGEQPTSESLSRLGKELLGELDGLLGSSGAGSLSTLPSTTSTSLETDSMSTPAQFITSSSASEGPEMTSSSTSAQSSTSSSASKDPEMTSSSAPTAAPVSSRSESISSGRSTSDSSLEISSATTLSSPTLESSTTSSPISTSESSRSVLSSTISSSTPTTAPVSSRSESISSVRSTSSSSLKISSITALSSPTLESSTTSSPASTSESSRSVSSPTISSSTSKSHTTASKPILATSAESSQFGPSSTLPSIVFSFSATELSHNTKTNTATDIPSHTSSRSTSESPTSALAPTSLLPGHESQTAVKESKATSTTPTPSFTPLFQVITTDTPSVRPPDTGTLQLSPSSTEMADDSPASSTFSTSTRSTSASSISTSAISTSTTSTSKTSTSTISTSNTSTPTISASSISTSTTSTSTTSTSKTSTSTTSTSTTSTSTTSTSTTSTSLPVIKTHTAAHDSKATLGAGSSSNSQSHAHSGDEHDGSSVTSPNGNSHRGGHFR